MIYPPPKAQTPMNAQVSHRKVLLILNSRLESHHFDGAPKEQVPSKAWHESLRYQGQGERHPSIATTHGCAAFGSLPCKIHLNHFITFV